MATDDRDGTGIARQQAMEDRGDGMGSPGPDDDWDGSTPLLLAPPGLGLLRGRQPDPLHLGRATARLVRIMGECRSQGLSRGEAGMVTRMVQAVGFVLGFLANLGARTALQKSAIMADRPRIRQLFRSVGWQQGWDGMGHIPVVLERRDIGAHVDSTQRRTGTTMTRRIQLVAGELARIKGLGLGMGRVASILLSTGLPRALYACDVAPAARGALKRLRAGMADALIEASGSAHALADAWKSVHPNGVVTAVALYSRTIDFDLTQFLRKQIDLRTSYASSRNDYLNAFELLKNGAVDASILTQSYSLKDAEEGFIDSENLEVTKVLLDCSQT